MESVIRRSKTQTGTDRYGEPTWTITETTVENVLVALGASSDDVAAGRVAADSTVTMYMPFGTVNQTDDVWVVRGEEYEQNGQGWDWSGFDGYQPGTVVGLKRAVLTNG